MVHLWEQEDLYYIFHNGRRNGLTNRQVINKVKKCSPKLIIDEKIFLGLLPANKSITKNSGSDFIERLIEYASIRVKLIEKNK